MEDKIYGIFSGCYSDWNVHGYFTDKDEAEKYCAIKNRDTDGWGGYYIIELNSINANVENVTLKYYHEVVFDFSTGMRNEPDRYDYYIGKDKPSRTEYNIFRNGNGWISFSFNCDNREKAEKIAQDKYAEFLSHYSETQNYDDAAKLINAIHR